MCACLVWRSLSRGGWRVGYLLLDHPSMKLQRGHAMSALLFSVVPVLVSLVVQQTPSMLTTHRVEGTGI
jgi:hypothetical protein